MDFLIFEHQRMRQSELKKYGNELMKQGKYFQAVEAYSEALEFRIPNNVKNDSTILSNRSHAFFKIGDLQNAMDDAFGCIHINKTWWKGYFRVAACLKKKGEHRNTLMALIEGLPYAKTSGQYARENTISFIVDIAQIGCKVEDGMMFLHNCLDIRNDIWSEVTLRLARHNEWEAIYNMFLGGWKDKPPKVGGIATGCDTSRVSIDQLCRREGQTDNGIDLAVELVKHGSDPSGLCRVNNEPALHCALRYGLVRGNLSLLRYLFAKYPKAHEEKNVINQRGESLYHILVRIIPSQPQIMEIALRMIIKSDANPCLKDPSGRMALDYLPSSSHPAILLRKAMDKYSAKMPTRQKAPQKAPPAQKREVEAYKAIEKSTYQTAVSMKINEKWQEALKLFCKYLNESHASPIVTNDIERSKTHIVEILQHVREVQPKVECQAPPSIWKLHIKTLAEKHRWKQLYLLLNGGGNGKSMGEGGLANGCDVCDVSIQSYLSSGHNDPNIKKYDMVKALLENGAKPDGLGDQLMTPLAYALRLLEDYGLVHLLLQFGADPSSLSLTDGDTPLHAALAFALKKKDHKFEVLKNLLERHNREPDTHPNLDPCVQDEDGNTLFHHVIQGPCSHITLSAVKLMQEYKVDPQIKNNQGKVPLHSLKKDDRRLPYLKMAAQHYRSAKPKGKKVKILKEPVSQVENGAKAPDVAKNTDLQDDSIRVTPLEGGVSRRPPKEEMKARISAAIEEIPQFIAKRPRLENVGEQLEPNKTSSTPSMDRKSSEKNTETVKVNEEQESVPDILTRDGDDGDDGDEVIEDDDEGLDEMGELDPSLFDDLVWEVECTSAVWKILRDKRLEHGIKIRIINKIRLLASGNWRPDLAKRLEGVAKQNDINLFEAKLTKAARILWELAIAFSPRCSEDPEKRLQLTGTGGSEESSGAAGGRIYSEIIRVWDIVFDHDNVSRSIDNIVKSHRRGQDCIIKKNLRGIDRKEFTKGKSVTEERIPMLYREITRNKQKATLAKKKTKPIDNAKLFFPPASSNETEYHIMKFYSFSSTLVNNILHNEDIKVDFPFRVTELEHAIINLQPNPPSAILLLGRSGTGKTTCCLYRLWTSFIRYWEHAAKSGEPLIPRHIAYIHVDEKAEDGDDDEEKEEENGEGLDEDSKANSQERCEGACVSALPACPTTNCDDGSVETNQDDDEAVTNGDDDTQMDHLHQIFVTKNAVLCSEVKKNFRELSHANAAAKDHVEVEDLPLPHRLQEAHPAQYPMFVTSRQWLLMLDATLPDPFFQRKPDGSLKKEVKGWGTDDYLQSFIPQLGEDDEDDDDEEYGDGDDAGNDDADEDDETLDMNGDEEEAGQRKEVDPRKEVTYEVFAYELWSKVNKKKKVAYHPTLVWMEIKSFIQGSVEALHTENGYLSLEQYQELGRKRAPNFTADRIVVYNLFQKYRHIKSHRGLFDESDLVFSIYNRLKKVELPDWCVHQFYIDETQDFTQAELSLLIRCSSDPNALFLTGDTAQSIMRGVAFRFDDLKTLFHYASKSMKAVGKTSRVTVPKRVYQLTHNYRSHAGILDLATSVVDLMIEFFPESFDRLEKDQGLFDGPRPVLLESCSFSDLALLLRGNKRKTSEIEFGAHQVILVANEEAKGNLPKELSLGLVLTIYESKGLEFDDVLLYNFFKDSPAHKEWRVVIAYLEMLIAKKKDTVVTSTGQSLVEIDPSAKNKQSDFSARPLEFDHDKHKVLNSELKYLYTAVTRARVNVWLFDEDAEKRAPIFEYFRRRNLVQVVRVEESESGEEGLSDGMFATTSTPEEWNKRGDYFYNNKLWKVAAKCYFKGGDDTKEKMSLAQDRALNAEMLRDNPRKLREEFLFAADEFVQCDLYQPAASCLYNAKEYQLAALLFEKIGKFTNAALLNEKRLKKPLDAARCYEQSGNYRKAVELLFSAEAYDKAADTVERYNIKKKEYEDKNLPLPEALRRNPPGQLRTIERLSYLAAEMHHHARNFGKMREAISQFPHLEDQLRFLREKNRIEEAATLLKENGRRLEAAKLMRSRGKLKEALDLVEARDDVTFRAEVLLAYGRIHAKTCTDERSEILSYLTEASALFKEVNNPTGEAEATMLTAALIKDARLLESAQKLFAKANNIRGQIECVDILVKNWPLTAEEVLTIVLRTLEQLFKLISVLYKPAAIEEKHLAQLCDSFYGLKEVAPNKKEVLVHEGARFMTLDSEKSPSVSSQPKGRPGASKEVDVTVARTSIMKHIFSLASRWVKSARAVLQEEKRQHTLCHDYIVGVQCSKEECPYLHEEYKRFAYFNYLKALTTEIMLTDLLMKTKKLQHFGVLQREMASWCPTEEDAEKLCLELFQALLPKHFHMRISSEKPAAMADVLRIVRRLPVQNQLRAVAKRMWEAASVLDKRSNTDLYFLIWIFHLLAEEDPQVFKKWLVDMQAGYFNEVVRVRRVQHPEIIPQNVGLISQDRGRKVDFYSMIHPFLESSRYLHACDDPVQSVGSFNRFIGLPAKRACAPLIPSIHNVVMMMELKYTLCMTMFAKVRNVGVIVPASYLAQINFFDRLCTPKKAHHMYSAVNIAKIDEQSLRQLGGHIRFLVNLLCGELYSGGFNVLKDAFGPDTDEYITTGEAERSLVLALVMLSNMGSVTPLICEQTLRKHLMQIRVDKRLPPRVADAVRAVQRAEGYQDVVAALKTLLRKREREYLHQCRWMWRAGSFKGLYYKEVQEVHQYQRYFYKPLPRGITVPAYDSTSEASGHGGVATVDGADAEYDDSVSTAAVDAETKEDEGYYEQFEEAGMSAEEIERARQDQAEHDRQLSETKAADVIIRAFRRYRFFRNLTILALKIRYGLVLDPDIVEETTVSKQPPSPGIAALTELSTVSDKMCGICGVIFTSGEDASDNVHQYAQIKLEMDYDQEEPQSPDSLLQSQVFPQTPTTPTSLMTGPRLLGGSGGAGDTSPAIDTGASPSPVPGPWGDVLIQRDDLPEAQVYKVHMQNTGHWEKSRLFKLYKEAYVNNIHPTVTECEAFFSEVQEQGRKSNQLALDIQQLRQAKARLDEEISGVLTNRHWEKVDEVSKCAKDVKTSLKKVQDLFKDITLEEESKAGMAASAFDGDEDADEAVVLAAEADSLEDESVHLLEVDKSQKKTGKKRKPRRGRNK